MPPRSEVRTSIYALEAAIWGALTAAWVSLRLAVAQSLADQSILIAAVCLAVVHFVLSSIIGNSARTDGAYFNALFPLWAVFTLMVVEASTSPIGIDKALFGGATLFVIPAACSLAFLTVQTILSAAAVCQNTPLWNLRPALWVDETILLVSAVYSCLCSESQLEFAGLLLGLQILFIGTLGARLWETDYEFLIGAYTIPLAQIWEIVHDALGCVLCILTVAAAYVTHTTKWALVVVAAMLVALVIVRAIYWSHAADVASTAHPDGPPPEPAPLQHPSAALVFASQGVSPQQPIGRLLAPPSTSRPAVKKQL